MPSIMASMGALTFSFFPFTASSPLSGLSAPYMARTSSERPEPRSPVRPMTSPLWISRLKGLMVPLQPSSLALMITSSLTMDMPSFLMAARSSKSLPIILATSCTLGSSSTLNSPTSVPFLRTVILSQTAYTCSRKWVTKMIPIPLALSCLISTNNFSTSPSSREDVGSSRISTLADMSTALAMAIICWMAME